jgi:hypothetical protein
MIILQSFWLPVKFFPTRGTAPHIQNPFLEQGKQTGFGSIPPCFSPDVSLKLPQSQKTTQTVGVDLNNSPIHPGFDFSDR